MANVNAPFGFRPIRAVTGYGHVTEEQEISPNLAVPLYAGDLVKSDGSGGITAAAAGDPILGVFLGWYLPDRSLGAANHNGPISAIIPHSRKWTPGTFVPTGIKPRALIHWDPNETLEAQCIGSLTSADIGAFVNAIPLAGDDAFLRSGWAVGPVSPEGGAITAITPAGDGTGSTTGDPITVTRHASDPYIGAGTATGTVTANAGDITGVTITAGGFYSASHLPTITVAGNSGNTFTVTVTNVTRDQFRVERILEKPQRNADSNNNTIGYNLSGSGLYTRVELRCVNHERGGVMGVAV